MLLVADWANGCRFHDNLHAELAALQKSLDLTDRACLAGFGRAGKLDDNRLSRTIKPGGR
jgi:hypothetical protein